MIPSLLRFGSVLTLGLLLLGAVPDFASEFDGHIPPRMADTSTAPHDTLTSQVPADVPLVRPLPKKVNGATATRYRVLNGPALSGVAGHSFTWIPRDASPGTYSIRLRVDHPNAAPDTLLLQVNVGS